MMEATPKRKNRQREHLGKQQQQQPRRYDFDSTSSSSESGGLSSPSPNLPLRYQQSPPVHNDSSSTGSPVRSRTIRETGKPETPTPTTTIGQARSPRSKQIHGKLSRPRRRSHRNFGNLNVNHHINNSYSNMHMSDCSLNSLDSTSDHSRLSKYTATTKTTTASGNTGLSRRASSSNSLQASNGNQQHFFASSNSLLGLAPRSSTNEKDHSEESYEYYHKHHHHPQHYDSYASPPLSPASSLPPLPSLRLIASDLVLICKLYGRHGIRSIRQPCRRFRKRLLQGLLSLAVVVLVLLAWLCYDFYADAVDVCRPPPSARHLPSDFAAFLASQEGSYINATDFDNGQPRPLVEYYVHGRGIGHYARSIAIVEQLNRAGVDVRMFLTRASLWRAMHEDSKIIVDPESDLQHSSEGQHKSRPLVKRGKTTAISITSLTPDLGFFDSLSHALERISGDCEVSASSGRYPQLVISDGDFPGMIRAEIGGIPSVGIAHGQLFTIAQKPKWVQESAQLSEAWDKQGRLNHVSSYFAEWQIATHFCFLESRYNSGTVARAPLRPEVLQMAESRKWARRGKMMLATSELENNAKNGRLPQAERIEEILHAGDPRYIPTGTNSMTTNILHRKVVICYFRDHNGEELVQALLDANFDVVLFETGYTRDMAHNPYRYGVKWIVKDEFRDKERKKYISDENENGSDANGFGRKDLTAAEDSFRSNNHGNNTQSNYRAGDLTIEGHSFEVHRSRQGGPKLIRVMDRSLFVPLMHVADGVASSAGSQLMSECIYSHMPLLAMYKEDDSEQRLNVELSHHINAPCHQPLVFGNSFESLTSALQSNRTSAADDLSAKNPVLESFKAFVNEVHSSSVSRTYFESVRQRVARSVKNHEHMEPKEEDSDAVVLEQEDPFRGLPDAAAIILEIIKQVVQKG